MKVKKYKNGGKTGDPKKKKDFSADYEARKKKKKSSGWDEEREPKKRGRDKQTPLLSKGAQESIKKGLMSEAKTQREVDRQSRGYVTSEEEARKKIDYRKERMKGRAKALKEGKYVVKRKNYYKELTEGKSAKRDQVAQKRADYVDKQVEAEIKRAKTPEEKQRIKDLYYSKKTQASTKHAKEYKKGGKVKDKLKALTKKKYKNGGKVDVREEKRERRSDIRDARKKLVKTGKMSGSDFRQRTRDLKKSDREYYRAQKGK